MRKQEQQTQVFDLPIPNTEELERRVLADAICAPEMLGDIIPIIHPDFFTADSRRRIWDTILTRYNNGDEIGFSLGVDLGQDFIKEVVPYTGDAGTSEMPFRAAQLRNGAAKRRAYMAAAQFLQDAVKPGVSEQEILTSVEAFSRMVEGPAPVQGERTLAEVLADVREEMEQTEKAVNAGINTRVTTGFKYMDLVMNGGFKAGQLIVLAARPSVGKTSVMLQMAKAAAIQGNPVQLFSLEMVDVELGEKFLFSTGKVNPYDLNHGQVDKAAYAKAEEELRGLPIYVNDFSRSIDEIVSRMTQAVKKGRCKAAYIDYLGLVQDAMNFGNAKLYQVIARLTGTCKAVAKRLRIPIIILCQMNRQAAIENRPPELYDLRDSGSIEQDADIVLMLESKLVSEGVVDVWLRKHRAGKKEIRFILRPNASYSAFTEEEPILPDGSGMGSLPEPTQGSLALGDDMPGDDREEPLPF